jgi:capsular polysaccharide export protein
MSGKHFLFLQGPISPFFPKLADALEQRGHKAFRINLNLGDRLFWRRPGAVDYRGRLADWPAFVEDFLDRNAITDIAFLGEQRAYHKAALAAARPRGIRVVATDFGYLRPDWITFERDGMNGASQFTKDPEEIRRIARAAPPADWSRRYQDRFFNQASWDIAYHLSQILWPFAFPHYQSHQLHHPILIYLGTGRRILMRRFANAEATRLLDRYEAEGTRYFFMPLQMETDFQLRAYSPFPDLSTPIRMIMRSFAANAPPDTRLLFKNHPLDPGLRNWRRRVMRIAAETGVGDRVDYLDGGDLDTMISGALGSVMVNSTVGLRALYLKKPVLILGDAVYRVPGMVSSQGLDDFWQAPQPPDPTLVEDFIAALAATIQIRGVYYNQPGIDAAVAAAAERLDRGCINEMLPVSRAA